MDPDKVDRALSLVRLLLEFATTLWRAVSNGDERSVDQVLKSPLLTEIAWQNAQLKADEKYKD